MTATDTTELPDDDQIPRSAKWLVAILFVLLLVPGIVGFDAWPLTGWRLFSMSRDATQNQWVVQAVETDGTATTVSLEELPLGYRHAEWPMAELPGASEAERQRICRALAGAVVDVRPDTVEVRLAKDAKRMVEKDGDWVVEHDPEVVTFCAP